MSIFDKLGTVYVKDGYLYTPVEGDDEICSEISSRRCTLRNIFSRRRDAGLLVRDKGDAFIRSVSLDSIIDNMRTIDQRGYDTARLKVYQKIRNSDMDVSRDRIDPLACTLIDEVLPRFVRFGREERRERTLTQLLMERLDIPDSYWQKVRSYCDIEQLEKRIDSFDRGKRDATPPTGRLSSKELESWVNDAVSAKIMCDERESLRQEIEKRKGRMLEKVQDIVVPLYVQESGIKIDDFGMYRMDDGAWIVYHHTGEYALEDFDGRIYRFPDCQVAVKVHRRVSEPIVINRYKHPFLEASGPYQPICIRMTYSSGDGLGENVIRNIEAGINTMLHGYFNEGDFNGYHLLGGRGQKVHFHNYHVDEASVRRDGIPITNRGL